MTRPSCFGRHDWTPPDARGRRKCRRCGDVTPRQWRCNDPALRAKVLGVDKPKPVIEGQTSLFDEVA